MNGHPHITVVIPYWNRLPYLERVLQALCEQDIESDDFEIVIGSLEHSAPLAAILAALPADIRTRCIMSREPWNVSRARNIALAHATGDVVLLLDADMLLPRSFLRALRDNYDLARRSCAVVGQMLNYSAYAEVSEENLRSYEFYRDAYLAHNCRVGLGVDMRWTNPRRILWSLCWSALIAIPRRLLEEHRLYFDHMFTGWGAEDLEWGYRLQQAGIAIQFADELWGIHLPHVRSVRKNCAQQERNYHRFLCKWPCFEVELVTRFGDAFVNERFDELAAAWLSACGSGETVQSVEFALGDSRCLALGAVADASGRLLNADQIPGIKEAQIIRQNSLLGLRLPYADRSLHTSYLLPSLRDVPSNLQSLIRSESERISTETVLL